MFDFLKKHPFAVEAYFDRSIVLTYAVNKETLCDLVPPCLELDTYKDKYGFIAVALVQTKSLRMKGFPKFMGNDFFLIGYRIFVRYTNENAKRLRGLYILRSETDKKKMEYLGSIFTSYNYSTIDVCQKEMDDILEISSQKSKFNIKVQKMDEDISLPDSSPFENWKEARRYAGPLPFTFSYDAHKKDVLIIEGVRADWTPKPLKVLNHEFNFVQELGLGEMWLANAFIIENIAYCWKKGKVEKWKN